MSEDVRMAIPRERYLRAARRLYGVALLPAPDDHMTLALEPIYQPLRLRQAPLAAGAERQVASEREDAKDAARDDAGRITQDKNAAQIAADVEIAHMHAWLFTHLSPGLFAWLGQALDSPHGQVRAAALRAFMRHRRNVPDALIRRLYTLRHDPESPCIQTQADQALAGILSLETGIEDE